MSIRIKNTDLEQDERKKRGKAQQIFLVLTHEYVQNVLERSYDVMGTTGNVYNVCIKSVPTCTCPDYEKRHKRCKHIYFVLSRIMKVLPEHEDVVQYSDDDLRKMINSIPKITENLRVDSSKTNRYLNMKNNNGEVKRVPVTEEDVCAVCLGEVFECDEELVYCRWSCGVSVHKNCFNMYNTFIKTDPKCIFCGKLWEKNVTNAYVNLLS